MYYKIIRTDSEDELVILVTDFIAQGWRPQGGVCVTMTTDFDEYGKVIRTYYTEVWAQAMVLP